ncbi:uncharacterized protein LTR77_007308 [Saxophila tyrrhenica]|uniref:Uncharacterized protein n=1 Tax=Saxophila tyrrhenica TaxID=1690608 RepID=A0AAV9P472_9PEZI|nr:hypothetical protein LTR77_007308 [Saxophila tyrrhenica]
MAADPASCWAHITPIAVRLFYDAFKAPLNRRPNYRAEISFDLGEIAGMDGQAQEPMLRRVASTSDLNLPGFMQLPEAELQTLRPAPLVIRKPAPPLKAPGHAVSSIGGDHRPTPEPWTTKEYATCQSQHSTDAEAQGSTRRVRAAAGKALALANQRDPDVGKHTVVVSPPLPPLRLRSPIPKASEQYRKAPSPTYKVVPSARAERRPPPLIQKQRHSETALHDARSPGSVAGWPEAARKALGIITPPPSPHEAELQHPVNVRPGKRLVRDKPLPVPPVRIEPAVMPTKSLNDLARTPGQLAARRSVSFDTAKKNSKAPGSVAHALDTIDERRALEPSHQKAHVPQDPRRLSSLPRLAPPTKSLQQRRSERNLLSRAPVISQNAFNAEDEMLCLHTALESAPTQLKGGVGQQTLRRRFSVKNLLKPYPSLRLRGGWVQLGGSSGGPGSLER